jgi:hypothetical protein
VNFNFDMVFWTCSLKPIRFEYYLYRRDQILLDCCFLRAGARALLPFFGRSELETVRQEAEAILYCGKGQCSWLFGRQPDALAVLKPTVKQDNKIPKQAGTNRKFHSMAWHSGVTPSQSPDCSKNSGFMETRTDLKTSKHYECHHHS